MINKLIVLFFIQVVFSQNCLEDWLYKKNNILDEKIYNLRCVVKQNKLINDFNLVIDKNNRFRIEYLDKIIISDNEKIYNYSKNTNQLFIEKADEEFNNIIFLLSNRETLVKNIKKISNKHFRFKKKYGNINLFFNENCDSLSIRIEKNKNIIDINNILLDSIYILNTDSLFEFDFDESEVFKYDFR